MITKDDIRALLSIISRYPMTPGEGLWFADFISRLEQITDDVERQEEVIEDGSSNPD